jgi:hypothetical protein
VADGGLGLRRSLGQGNTREAIFDAMVRRETYATTGPRMVVRFFGGWCFAPGDEAVPDVAATGHARGVPMGADLPARSSAPCRKAADGPTFLVSVLKDRDGANLDRVQVTKGWRDAEGKLSERVYDVALAGGRSIDDTDRTREPVGSTVDIPNARYTNRIGAVQLAAVWQDPNFDPKERTYYYLRALKIPKPRWTAYDAKFLEARCPGRCPW